MDALRNSGHNVRSMGLFDSKLGLIRTLIYMLSHPQDRFVSSNLRTNLVFLLFPWLHGLVILNGLGRHRDKRWLRRALILLFRINPRKQVVIQSYADFRYFRRFTPQKKFVWIPGSGGSVKKLGPQGRIVTVQRDDKLPIVAKSLVKIIKGAGTKIPLVVVGCKDSQVVSELLCEIPHISTGYLPADEILSGGQIFVQPSGYGEGFPHSLADAIVSGMEIIIAPIEYRRYGLYQFQIVTDKRVHNQLHFKPLQTLQEQISLEAITEKYVGLIHFSLNLSD